MLTKVESQFGVLIVILALIAVQTGCRSRYAVEPPPGSEADILKYLAEGDASFRDSHLYGWRQAESLYRKAFQLTASDEARRKLLLTRFLILIRQIDEEISNPEAEKTIGEVCAAAENPGAWCQIARSYGKSKNARQFQISDGSIFRGEHPELEAYFSLLLPTDEPESQSRKNAEILSGPSGESPLFLYLNLDKLRARDPVEIERAHPRFAEAFEFIGESLFQRKQYRTARTYFKKAIELIPDYTRPRNGIGNIYFFGMEDYETALRWYESALERNPENTAALFGKGAALHKLGRYQESDAILDRMLTADLLRNIRISGSAYLYYMGEGNYLKAYNHYLTNDPAAARLFIDAARQYLSDSEEILDLSGVLHLQARELVKARKDFLGVLAKGNSNCNAQMNLGLIYMEMKRAGIDLPEDDPAGKGAKGYLESGSIRDEPAEKKALNYFLGAGSCMESAVRYLNRQIDSIPSLDLEPSEQTLLRHKLQYKLATARKSYASNIETMLAEASENIFTSSNYLSLMREILARIRGP